MAQSGVVKRDSKFSSGSTRAFRSVVVLGSPRNKCNGTGICMVMSAKVSTVDWQCPYLKADLFLNKQGKLCFRFHKKSKNASRASHHFSGKTFQVVDAYQFPLHLQRGLGAEEALVVNPGIYPVVETQDYWLLEVDL